MAPGDFCFGNDVRSLSKNTLKEFGKSASNVERREFQESLRQTYLDTRHIVEASIGALDPTGNGSYRDGCKFLLQWYRNEFWNSGPNLE